MSQLELKEVEIVELSDSEPEPKKPANPEVLCVDSDDDDCIVVANSNVTGVESEPAKRDRLVKEFILMTKGSSTAASFFLETHDWKLDVAVNDFLTLTGQILRKMSQLELKEVEIVELSDSEPEPKKPANPEVLCVDSDDDDCIVVANSNVTGVESEPAKRDRLVKEFILITKTDSKAASFFLEQHDWKLDVAANDFLNLTGQILSENSSMAQSVQNEKWAKDAKSGAEVKGAFSFISWNVDGLDKRNLSPRTANLIKVLNQEAADIVFLQEVVPETINHLKSNLSIYDFTVQQYEKNMSEAYFVCTLTKRGAVKVVNKTELPFANSVMMRALLMVEVEIGGVKMWLMNTHLESTAQYKEARVSQLKFAFKQLTDKQRTHSVLFAGDLNLRDPEVPMAGGIPSCAFDLWEACDRRDVCKFTWDASRNTNIQFGNFGAREGNSSGRQFKPRLRFDRAYLAPCGRDGADRPVAKHFGLVGISKVPGMQCYTSDHWGLQVYFTVNKP